MIVDESVQLRVPRVDAMAKRSQIELTVRYYTHEYIEPRGEACQQAVMADEFISPFKSSVDREQQRIEKREAVLRVAVAMFNERGFHATSLDDVCALLGVRKPTIYNYFDSKDQILLECLTRGLEALNRAADAARDESGRGIDRLRAFLRGYAEINMTDFGRAVVRAGEEYLSPQSAVHLRDMKRQIDAAMRELIRDGMEDGSIAQGDVRMIAFALAGALNWPARWHNSDGTDTPEMVAASLVDILTAGLAPR